MNSVVAAFPDRQLHVILDNLSTHKKKAPRRSKWNRMRVEAIIGTRI
jgi:hypothetical protein